MADFAIFMQEVLILEMVRNSTKSIELGDQMGRNGQVISYGLI